MAILKGFPPSNMVQIGTRNTMKPVPCKMCDQMKNWSDVIPMDYVTGVYLCKDCGENIKRIVNKLEDSNVD